MCQAIIAEEVSLINFLLNLSAFENYEEGQPILLDHVKAKIESADSIHKIFNVLTSEFCSFINVGLFQSIMEKYRISTDSDEDLKYSEYLETYLKKHKISEFIMINPKLEQYTKISEKLILKFDINLSSKVTRVVNLKSAIAEVLDVRGDALQLVGVEEGCVVVTFSIPSSIARYIFVNGLTEKQETTLRAFSVLWLKCRDYQLGEFPRESKDLEDNIPCKPSNPDVSTLMLFSFMQLSHLSKDSLKATNIQLVIWTICVSDTFSQHLLVIIYLTYSHYT